MIPNNRQYRATTAYRPQDEEPRIVDLSNSSALRPGATTPRYHQPSVIFYIRDVEPRQNLNFSSVEVAEKVAQIRESLQRECEAGDHTEEYKHAQDGSKSAPALPNDVNVWTPPQMANRYSSAIGLSTGASPSSAFPRSYYPTSNENGASLLQSLVTSLQSMVPQSMTGSLTLPKGDETPPSVCVSSIDGESSPLAFSFSPAGLLFPYHLGVAKLLLDYNVITDGVPIAGASAGALTACVVGLNLDFDKVMLSVYSLEHNIRQFGARGRLKKVLLEELDRILPPNASDLLSKRPSPVMISYTQAPTAKRPWLRGQFPVKYYSKDDLIECVCASCNIPMYFTSWPFVVCRGQRCIDGYFAVPRRNFGCPTVNGFRTIRVLPFSAATVGLDACDRDCISPDLARYDKHLARLGYMNELQAYLRDDPAPTCEFLLMTFPHDFEHLRESLGTRLHKRSSSLNKLVHLMSKSVSTERCRSGLSPEVSTTGSSTCQNSPVVSGRIVQNKLKFSQPKKNNLSSSQYSTGNQRRTVSVGNSSSSRGDVAIPRLDNNEMKNDDFKHCQTETAPDVSNIIPVCRFTTSVLLKYALGPTESDEIVRELYDLGRADAFRWLKLQSIPNLGNGERRSVSSSAGLKFEDIFTQT